MGYARRESEKNADIHSAAYDCKTTQQTNCHFERNVQLSSGKVCGLTAVRLFESGGWKQPVILDNRLGQRSSSKTSRGNEPALKGYQFP